MTLYEKMMAERSEQRKVIARHTPIEPRVLAPEPQSAGRSDDDLIEAFEMSEAEGYVLSVVTGEPVEPDHPDSPLRRAGCI